MPPSGPTPYRDSDGFAPIADYAILSDMRSVALVAKDGSIDWWAAPVLDEPPVCAAVLGPAKGGFITITPTDQFEVRRNYRPGTLVLDTHFTTGTGSVTVSDALNLGSIGLLPWAELARVVTVREGEVPLLWEVAPGQTLECQEPWVACRHDVMMAGVGSVHLVVTTGGLGQACMTDKSIKGHFTARAGETYVLAVTATRGEPAWAPDVGTVRGRLERTAERWGHWSSQISYEGPFREAVVQSALAIKALTLQPTGGIAAAATTSLPEKIGGKRNFDYRFAWVRDVGFSLDAMGRLGLDEELHAGASWLLSAAAREQSHLRVFYSIQGQIVPADMTEAPLAGYKGSKPVNTGNKAASQLQLGTYGDLVDAVWRYIRNGGKLDASTATLIGEMADEVCRVWGRADAGLWELGDQQQYASSKIGCWTILDRATLLSDQGQLASINVDRWRSTASQVQSWVREHCWSEAKQSFTFYAGTDDLDAAVLLAAHNRFCARDDPMLASTIEAIRSELRAEGPLLYRYSGQAGQEGAFTACSFWLIEALAYTGRKDEAAKLMAEMVSLANDVGLFSEEMAPEDRSFLGNTPQALSHLALIGAATALDSQ